MKNKKKILIIVAIILFIVGIFIMFKAAVWGVYKSCIYDIGDFSEMIEGYKNSEDITIKQKEYNDYLDYKWFSVGNFFVDFNHDPNVSTEYNETYYQYEGNKKVGMLSVGTFESLVDAIHKDDITIYGVGGDENGLSFGDIFYSGIDNFVKEKNIKDDADLIREFSKYNYDKEYGVFTSISKLREDFSIRLLASITLPSINKIYYINGDFKGYILEIINEDKGISCYEVDLFRNGKRYILTVLSKDVDFDMIKEVVSTIKLK